MALATLFGVSPKALFAMGEQGAWYDPVDLSTGYQDSAGTTAGALEQPDGLRLDKRLGLTLGGNIAPGGGTFENLNGWTNTSGAWVVEGGRAKLVGDGTLQSLAAPVLTIGNWYVVEFDFERTAGVGFLGVYGDGGSAPVLTLGATTGHQRAIFRATSITFEFKRTSSALTCYVDNVTICELPGNHATQATTPARPKPSARVNLLQKTEDTASAPWVFTNFSGSAVAQGGNTYTFGASPFDRVTQGGVAVAAGVGYVGRMKLSGSGTVRVFGFSGLGGTTLLETVTLTATPTWYGGSYTNADAGGNGGCGVYNNGVGTAGAVVTIHAIDYRTAADAALAIPAYQRVNTATDYDTGGFPVGDNFDGADDYLTAAAGGSASVSAFGFFYCAAIRVNGGASTIRSMFGDHSGFSGFLVSIDSTNKLRLAVGNGAAFTFLQSAATIAVGETHVVTCWDDGVNINVQIDNGAVASVARPAVAAGTVGFTIGKSNTSAAEFFNGRIYGMVHRFGTPVDAARRERVKRFMAARAGVTL